jgi:hypothetical protein
VHISEQTLADFPVIFVQMLGLYDTVLGSTVLNDQVYFLHQVKGMAEGPQNRVMGVPSVLETSFL